MPSANGLAVLMQFDNIQSTVSFICELADCLAARLFHWTFWHSVPSTDCDCNTSFGQNVAPIGMLYEEEIIKLYFEPVSQKRNRRNYFQSHKQKARESETPEKKEPKEDILINYIRKHQEQMKHKNKLNTGNRWTKQKNCRLEWQKS